MFTKYYGEICPQLIPHILLFFTSGDASTAIGTIFKPTNMAFDDNILLETHRSAVCYYTEDMGSTGSSNLYQIKDSKLRLGRIHTEDEVQRCIMSVYQLK
jgi:hypothetical protein